MLIWCCIRDFDDEPAFWLTDLCLMGWNRSGYAYKDKYLDLLADARREMADDQPLWTATNLHPSERGDFTALNNWLSKQQLNR